VTISIYLRGWVKREDLREVDLLARDDDVFAQPLSDGLAVGKRESIAIIPSSGTKVIDVVDPSLPGEGGLLRVSAVAEFSSKLGEFRGQFLPPEV